MKANKILLVFFILLNRNIFPQKIIKRGNLKGQLTCKSCHSCQFPTAEKPCLWPCPRFEMIKSYKFNVQIPDLITISRLSKLYGKVIFPHKIHAEMSEISGGCVQCHHYTTDKKIRKCADCHSVRRKRTDVTRPDLRGAYHQRCMNCHIKWSHSFGCNSCHAPKNKPELISQKFTTKKILQHKKKKKPERIVFETTARKGKFVTFYHAEHVDLFGLPCSDCHHNEKCINCHDVQKSDKPRLKIKAIPGEKFNRLHNKCSLCHHLKENCTFCHSQKIKPPFSHEQFTGWALNRFHKILKCSACHGNRKKFTKLKPECANCHSEWSPENFNHRITGILLDENHKDNDCETCHKKLQFNKVGCTDCHDDKSFPKNIPGKLIKIKGLKVEKKI